MVKLDWLKEKQIWKQKIERKMRCKLNENDWNRIEAIKTSYNLLHQNWLLTHQYHWLFVIELKHHVKHLN